MTAATQVALAQDAWPVTSAASTFADIREALVGIVETPGLLNASAAANVLSATSTWTLNIAPLIAALMRDVPAALVGNSSWGVAIVASMATVPLVLPAAPASQAIKHTIFIKANDAAKGEDGLTVVDYVSSGIAASPTYQAPPEGGVELGTVLIPAGATSLQSTGVVITNIPKRAIISGTPLVVKNAAQRDKAIQAGGENQGPFIYSNVNHQRYLQDSGIQVKRLDTGIVEQYFAAYNASTNPIGATDAGWYPAPGQTVRARAYRDGTASIASGSARTAVTMTVIEAAYTQGGSFSLSSGGLAVPYKGEWEVRTRVTWPNSDASGVRLLSLLRNGSTEVNGIIDARAGLGTTSTYITIYETVKCSIGDTIQAGVAQTSGSTLVMPSPAVDITIWYKGMI